MKNQNTKTACLNHLHIILFKPQLAENIGSAARACANMNCQNLHLIRTAAPDTNPVRKLATKQGERVLKQMQIHTDLSSCLASFHKIYGTTARSGGWRKGIKTPAQAAPEIITNLRNGQKIAVIFGPENQGLTNAEIQLCSSLITIPTSKSSSLNLAHAVLLILYECFTQALEGKFRPERDSHSERAITQAEHVLLFQTIQKTLERIDFLHDNNSAYFMMPLRRSLGRGIIYRNEFNMLMGICRQILQKCRNGK